jgi:hypothetical protein
VHRTMIQSLLSLLVAGALSCALAASSAIGVAVASGTFRVDDSRVSGNTSLFEGNTIETGNASSQVQLNGGVRMELGSASRGKFYRDHMILEQGQTQLDTGAAYRIEALSLRVLPVGRSSAARVSFSSPRRVVVAALDGPVQVASANGVLLAKLSPGKALEFEPQAAGAAAPSTIIGRLERRNRRFLVTDETTGVTAEVSGAGLQDKVGKRVEITGNLDPTAKPTGGTTEVLQATDVKVLSGAAGGTAAATGMATSTKVIIAGVAVAGAGAGIGLTVGGDDDEKPSMSR